MVEIGLPVNFRRAARPSAHPITATKTGISVEHEPEDVAAAKSGRSNRNWGTRHRTSKRRKKGEEELASNPWFRAHRIDWFRPVYARWISVTLAIPLLPVVVSPLIGLLPYLSFKPFNFLSLVAKTFIVTRDCFTFHRARPLGRLRWTTIDTLCTGLDFPLHSNTEPTSRVTCFVVFRCGCSPVSGVSLSNFSLLRRLWPLRLFDRFRMNFFKYSK